MFVSKHISYYTFSVTVPTLIHSYDSVEYKHSKVYKSFGKRFHLEVFVHMYLDNDIKIICFFNLLFYKPSPPPPPPPHLKTKNKIEECRNS